MLACRGKKWKFVFAEDFPKKKKKKKKIVATNILLNFDRLQQFEGENHVKRKTLYLSLYFLI